MSTAKHADFDALSAFVDGEAPEWADHVAGCPQCRAIAAELRALSANVAAAGDSPPAAVREAAIAAALGAATFGERADAGATRPLAPAAARPEAQRDRFARRRWSPGSWAMPGIAAVVLACVGFAGVILSSTGSSDHQTATLAGPARDSKAESAVGAPTAPVGDLGDVSDAATLRARALGAPASASAAGGSSLARTDSPPPAASVADAQSSATNTGNTGAAVSSGVANGGAGGTASFGAAPSAAGGAAANIAPNAVATRPCEAQARSREPGLGPVTYFATARSGAVPTYVLGFATGPNITLVMLAQAGCTEVLRSAGP